MFSMGLENWSSNETREIQTETDIHRTIGVAERSVTESFAVVVEVKAVYRRQHLVRQRVFLFLFWLREVYPVLQLGFLKDSETEFRLQSFRGQAELRTRRNRVDRHHQRANGRAAQHVSLASRPRQGRKDYGIQVHKIHLYLHRS
jgi:hypothetical protein